MFNNRIVVGLMVLVAMALVGFVVLFGDRLATTHEDTATGTRVARGKQLYDYHCAACHGAKLEGEANWKQRKANGTLPAPPHDATGHTWHHADQQLFQITKLGTAAIVGQGYVSNMPGFALALRDSDIWDILFYIKSKWPEEIRARQAEISRRAAGNS